MNATPLQLQPLTMSQLLDRAVRVFRANFLLFLGIIAILQIPVFVIDTVFSGINVLQMFDTLFADPFQASPAPLFALGGATSYLATIVTSILTQLSNAALCWAVVNSLLGEKVTIKEAYRQLRTRWQSVLGVWFLSIIGIIALSLWWIVACVVGWFTGLGMLVFFAYIITPLALVVVMVEDITAWEAIPRAWNLARQRFWWVLFAVIFLTVLSRVLVAGPQALLLGGVGFFLIDGGIAGDFSNATLATIITSAVSLLLTLLVLPVFWTGMMALYLDLRVRFEGVDLALRIAQQDEGVVDEMSAEQGNVQQRFATLPRGKTKSAMPQSREWVAFLALTVGPFLLLIALYAVLIGLFFLLFAAGTF